jgi:hypothetical protein
VSKNASTSLRRYIHLPAISVPINRPASRSERIDRARMRLPVGSIMRAT